MPQFRVDLHAHARFFHAWPGRPTAYDPLGVRLLGRAARYRGLDAVAVTNHDYYEPFATDDVVALPGVEVSTTGGHVVIVGPDPPRRTVPDELTPAEAVSLAHDRDCAAILAHPFRRGHLRTTGLPFDAVELNGKRPQAEDRVRSLADELDLPVVAGSDAHLPIEVGRAFTLLRAPELTPEAVVDAIRAGRVEPCVAETRAHRMLRRGYAAIHEWKGHVAPTADGRRRAVDSPPSGNEVEATGDELDARTD